MSVGYEGFAERLFALDIPENNVPVILPKGKDPATRKECNRPYRLVVFILWSIDYFARKHIPEDHFPIRRCLSKRLLADDAG
jgi:hypothetical protein